MRIMGSSSSMAIIFLLTLLELCGLLQSAPLAPALYVFGDSLFDSGNNNLLPTAAKANYRPYGVNFVHGVTGRFTNNRTAADVIGIIYISCIPLFISITLYGGVCVGIYVMFLFVCMCSRISWAAICTTSSWLP